MIRRATALALVVVAACSSSPPKQAFTPPASPSALPSSLPPTRSIAPLASGQPCPRPTAKRLHRSFGLAFGDGPVYAVLTGAPQETKEGLVRYGGGADDGTGHAVKVMWVWDSRYNGPVFVRARRIDAPGTLRFNAEPPAAASGSQLALPKGKAVDSSGWHTWGTHVRFNAPGCYAFQIDGEGFSTVLRFEAIP